MENTGLPLLLACSADVAAMLGLTQAQLYRMSNVEGMARVIGKRRYLRRDALLAYLGIGGEAFA